MENFESKKDKKLWSAAESGDLNALQKALEDGANVNGTNYLDMTALHAVLDTPFIEEDKQLEIVKELTEQGVDIDKISSLGENALSLAVKAGRFEIIKFLHKKGADIFKQTDNGANYIYMAAENYDGNPDYLKIIEYFIENGVDPNDEISEGNQNVLFRTVDLGFSEVIDCILKSNKIKDLNTRDEWGLRPLHYAARQGHLDVVKLFVEAGADVNVQEDYGFTPLHEAAENGNLEVAKYLTENKANASIGLKSGFDSYSAGDTPYDIAVKSGNNDIAEFLKSLK